MNPFFHLIRKDLIALRSVYLSKFFDTCLLFFTSITVFGYFMPQLGVSTSYGVFILIGSIGSYGLFDVVEKTNIMITDIQGPRTISQTLIYPMRASAVFICIGLSWGISSLLLTLPLFPVGKILLFTRFDLAKIHYFKLALLLITINVFYGFFALWVSSIVRSVRDISSLYFRFINPVFMFGAYFYSWKTVFSFSPLIGYISLINPMVYAMEGIRAAAIGQEGYLPYWTCFFVLWGFTLTCGFFGTRRLKKRLDAV